MTAPTDFPTANTIMLQTFATLSALAWQRTAMELETMEKLTGILAGSVPPEKISQFFEFGYARRDALPAEVLPAFADVGQFAWTMGFYGLGVDNRGALMEALLRGQALPEGASAPVPNAAFSPAVAL